MRTQTTRLRLLALTAVLVGLATALAATASQPASAAFPGGNGEIAFTKKFDVYVMNADGSGQINLTNDAASSEPAWSPDGSRIAFGSSRSGNSEVWVMNANGSGQTNLTNLAGFDSDPAWSPDGSRIAFFSDRNGNAEVWVMNADGSGQTNLTNHAGPDFQPAWSPDGSRIAFMSRRDGGNNEVYVMNADGSGQTNLTNNAGFDFGPAWSPDGSRIAFWSERDGNAEVYVMNADGSGQTNLTNDAAFDGQPAWSPDGSKIVFASRRDGGNSEVYAMNADGSGSTRLTSDAEDDSQPDWQPLRADLAVTVQAPETAPSGSELTYTIVVSNAGPQDAHNVVLTDPTPAGAKFVSAITTQGSCTTPSRRGVGLVSCNLGTLTTSLNAAAGITLKITAKADQTVNNVVRVSSDEYDPYGGDNVAVASTLVTRK